MSSGFRILRDQVHSSGYRCTYFCNGSKLVVRKFKACFVICLLDERSVEAEKSMSLPGTTLSVRDLAMYMNKSTTTQEEYEGMLYVGKVGWNMRACCMWAWWGGM